LSRTPAHLKALRRNLAQSLFQHGQVRTTLQKAKMVRPFVERLVTLARKDTLHSRQRVAALLGDRAILDREQEEKYAAMSDAQRQKVMTAPSGRRHRVGRVPAAYNKKKIPFVAQSVVHKLMTEIAPAFRDRPGGYTRIIRLPDRRIGDNGDLAILQLVGLTDEASTTQRRGKKTLGLRRQRTLERIAYLEGKRPKRSRKRTGKKETEASKSQAAAPPEESQTEVQTAADDENQPKPGAKADGPEPQAEAGGESESSQT